VQAFAKSKQQSKSDAAKLLLVDFVSRQRSREQGEKTLREFIARDPDNYDLRIGLGALLQRAGANPEALTAYREVVARDGTGAKALLARDRMAAIQLQQGHTAEAGKLLTEVLDKNPRDDDAMLLRAEIAMQRNDPSGAIGDLRAVLRDQPNSAELQRRLAAAYIAKGQPALAEEALRAAMRATPNDAATRIELAQLLARTDRAPQGIALLEETVKLLPANLPASEALIRAYMTAGNLQGAHDLAADLQTRQPQSSVGFYYAGLIAAQQKHLDESQSALERAFELQPQRPEILTALVRVQVARGAAVAAIGRVQALLADDPRNVQLLSLLAELYFDRKDLGNSADALTRAIAAEPGRWQLHRSLAQVRLAADDPDGAVSEYQAALKLAPGEPQLAGDAARVYEKLGRIDAAIADYEGLYAANNQARQFAANNLAMLLVTYRKDRPSLDRARELTNAFATSDNGSLLDTAGWVSFKRGEYQAALTALERAAERAPQSSVIRFHLAMTQLQLGQRDRARTNLESALNGADSFQGVDEARVALASLKVRA
jgi:predicted Zn-dependent protease